MGYLVYALFVLAIAYGFYRMFRKIWKKADIDDVMTRRQDNSDIYETFKDKMSSNATEDADYCADKVEKLSNSKN